MNSINRMILLILLFQEDWLFKGISCSIDCLRVMVASIKWKYVFAEGRTILSKDFKRAINEG